MSTVAEVQSERSTRRPGLKVVEALEAGVAASREVGERMLDHLQTRLEAWRLRLDPSTQRWVEQARRSAADPSFEERVRNQPTPSELVEQVKQARQEA